MAPATTPSSPTRRTLLAAFLSVPAVPVLGSGLAASAHAEPPLSLTPACGDAATATAAQTAGPFFTPGSPLRHDLVPAGAAVEPITLAGLVTDRGCRPLAGAVIELWHAGAEGAYDNDGFGHRGHQFTDSSGRWWFTTIAPGLYPGRTRHYHVKVRPPRGRTLTTQLYFPGEPGNARDALFDPRLVLEIARGPDGRFARFDFVV